MNILVVDDNKDILEVMQLILEDAGYTVETADNGDYLEHLNPLHLPSIIFLDYLLSGRNGGELIKFLKSQEITKQIPVILNSAHPNVKNIWKEVGADDFLPKPFGITDVLAMVKKYSV